MIQGMFDSGALPALERLAQFTESRHRVLTNNIANLSNPYFKARDLDVKSFQAALTQAIEDRRGGGGRTNGPLHVRDTAQLFFRTDGITAHADEIHENVLFHDQNNIDLERNMQRLAENTMTHNAAIELIRNQFSLIQMAIRERP
ncbi:MAG: hypothetical protein WD768_03130 [Phycisphaeraceae bacterium]